MESSKFYIESYGCSANTADAEIIAGQLQQAGFILASAEDIADLNIIVTCTVKEITFQRMLRRIQELTAIGKPLVVAGCMPKTEAGEITRINPAASFLGPNNLQDTLMTVKLTLKNQRVEKLADTHSCKLGKPRLLRNPLIGIVPIASGCLSSCTYCQIRFARGKLYSYPEDIILKEIKSLVNKGCREIWLTSQDNGCYGKDIGTSLSNLLRHVNSIEGNFMVRIGMINPTHILRDLHTLTDVFNSRRIFQFLHIPVQSGSDRILKLMQRGYYASTFKIIVDTFRRKLPWITISTDIIVGFPGETVEDFQQTLELVKDVSPDIVNISRFSPRSGTKAAAMEQIQSNLNKQRTKRIHELTKKIALQKNSRWLGWRGQVLVDEQVRDAHLGRNFAYKPVLVNTKNSLGTWVEVQITAATAACLRSYTYSQTYVTNG